MLLFFCHPSRGWVKKVFRSEKTFESQLTLKAFSSFNGGNQSYRAHQFRNLLFRKWDVRIKSLENSALNASGHYVRKGTWEQLNPA